MFQLQTHAGRRRPAGGTDSSAQRVSALVAAVREAHDLVGATVAGSRAPSVVLSLVGSSRGGTSLTHSLLRRTGLVRTLTGEHTHLYKLHGVSFPWELAASDATVTTPRALADIGREITASATIGAADATVRDAVDLERFAVDWTARMVLQWPALAPDVRLVHAMVRGEISRLQVPAGHDPWVVLLLRMIYRLRAEGHDVDPYYYDLPRDLVGRFFPTLSPPTRPPQDVPTLLEEPPFIVPAPTTRVPDGADLPLVVKSSVDAYRVESLAEVFPDSDVRVVHITRNAAASVNGLVDGWLDRGFYSYDLSPFGDLDITGYSEDPLVGSWWNFDLPPGWDGMRGRRLSEVCAHQWTSAHAAILDGLERAGLRAARVAAEGVMHDRAVREVAVSRMLHLAGVDGAPSAEAFEVSPVMATRPPGPARWHARRADVEDAVAAEATRQVGVELGYGESPDDRWI